MKAFVARGRNDYEIMDVPMPELGSRDVLVRVKCAAICGSDLHIYDGSMDPLCGYPVIMGHENAGVVEWVGEDAPGGWKVGDRVTSENTVSVCGACYSCQTGDYAACEQRRGFGIAADGSFAEYIRIPGDMLALQPDCLMKLPDNVSFEEAVLMEPAANAYKSVFQEGELMAGETVLITGAGTFAAYCVHMAALGGASCIAVLVRKSTSPKKLEIVKRMGATEILYADEEPEKREKELARCTGGYGFNLAVETTGASSVLDCCIRSVHTQGRVVRVAISDAPFQYSMNMLTLRSVKLIGHLGYNPVSWHNVMNLAEKGMLDLHTVVTKIVSLEQVKEGFEALKARKEEKVLVTMK